MELIIQISIGVAVGIILGFFIKNNWKKWDIEFVKFMEKYPATIALPFNWWFFGDDVKAELLSRFSIYNTFGTIFLGLLYAFTFYVIFGFILGKSFVVSYKETWDYKDNYLANKKDEDIYYLLTIGIIHFDILYAASYLIGLTHFAEEGVWYLLGYALIMFVYKSYKKRIGLFESADDYALLTTILTMYQKIIKKIAKLIPEKFDIKKK